jgi:hypothetical protein
MRDRFVQVLLALVIVLLLLHVVGFLCSFRAHARDLDGRYANSPLKSWFASLRSDRGPCCSDADGYALSDVDWETKDGHYRVRIQWFDVPPEARQSSGSKMHVSLLKKAEQSSHSAY